MEKQETEMKWKLEIGNGNGAKKTHQSLVQSFLHSVLNHVLSHYLVFYLAMVVGYWLYESYALPLLLYCAF